jgi:hypothetical protein
MIVKTRLAEILDELTPQLEEVNLRGKGASSFIYAVNKGRAVEISENDDGFWLEFWEKSDDEDAAPVKEITVDGVERATSEARRWLVLLDSWSVPMGEGAA